MALFQPWGKCEYFSVVVLKPLGWGCFLGNFACAIYFSAITVKSLYVWQLSGLRTGLCQSGVISPCGKQGKCWCPNFLSLALL